MNFAATELLTFDCYGTLIDWETGILTALKPLLASHGVQRSDEELLESFARFEEAEERGQYQTYRHVLMNVTRRFGEQLGIQVRTGELDLLADSIRTWPPFADSPEALRRLARRFKLAVLSNIDDALLRESQRLLGCDFDWVITAEQVRSYKPGLAHFRRILEVSELPPERVIHVGQSLHHDAPPAAALGIPFVWVNRRKGKRGFGATVPGLATPELEVTSLEELARLLSF